MGETTFSIENLFLGADPVVQLVIILLFLASLFTWFFLIEKSLVLHRMGKDMRNFGQMVPRLGIKDIESTAFPLMAQDIVRAGVKASNDVAGGESRADFRERVERAMREVFYHKLYEAGNKTTFLASVGSSSPFIGLFGTVWGIMHSFVGIANSGETTLAVIAPGIAEALFATAMGLVAAIPAVLGYNKITRTMKDITAVASLGIGTLGNTLARENCATGVGPQAG